MLLFRVRITMRCHETMYDFPMLFLHYFEGFWVFTRNRLAAQPLPPGDTSEVSVVLDSGLNRLAAMSICQAARHDSRFFFIVLMLVV